MPTIKNLDSITAREVMSVEPVTAEPWMTARQFAQLLETEEVSATPVVDQQGFLVGVASRADLIHRSVSLDEDYELRYIFESLEGDDDTPPMERERELHVEEFMVEDVVTVMPRDSVRAVAAKMVENKVHRVVVVEGRTPVGIITSLDIAGLVAEGVS